MSRLFPVGRRIVRSGREVGAAGTGRADGKPLAARGIVGSVLHGGRVFVARLFPLLGGGSCPTGAKSASWNGPGGWQAAGGPWHRRQCLAGRPVFVASAFPVGRRIERSGHEVGQLERQAAGGPWHRRQCLAWRARLRGAAFMLCVAVR